MRVGVVGAGRMGVPISRALLRAGHAVAVWDPFGRGGELADHGATVRPELEDAVHEVDLVFTMLDVDAMKLAAPRIAASAPADTLVVDASTIGPLRARAFAARFRAAGLRYVDAPVIANPAAPKRKRVIVCLGADDPRDLAEADALCSAFSDDLSRLHVGEVGAGNALKLTHLVALSANAVALGEALGLAQDLGLDRTLVLDSLAVGPMSYLIATRRDDLESGTFEAIRLSLERVALDLSYALEAATRSTPLLTAALQQVEDAVAAGHGDEDYLAITAFLEQEGRPNSW